MKTVSLKGPVSKDDLFALRAGDAVSYTGELYTARDVAHKRFCDALKSGKELPVSLEGAIIYYTGPAPAPPGRVIGSAGPTTSYRMDSFTPYLLENTGLTAMIGKGARSMEVIEAVKKNGAVYFAAIGGAGALIADRIISCETVCYEDLGPEAVRKLTVRDFPLYTAVDTQGNSLYKNSF
ncbi:MAG: Fe-S-containing hydro-lyase [Fibrobacterota bacterium]